MPPYDGYLAHAHDPATSDEAAEAASRKGLIDSHEWRILTVIKRMPLGGTGKELAAAIAERWRVPMTSVQVMRRMLPMVERHQVFRRPDPNQPYRLDARGRRVPNWLRRDGQVLYYRTPYEMPLFDGAVKRET